MRLAHTPSRGAEHRAPGVSSVMRLSAPGHRAPGAGRKAPGAQKSGPVLGSENDPYSRNRGAKHDCCCWLLVDALAPCSVQRSAFSVCVGRRGLEGSKIARRPERFLFKGSPYLQAAWAQLGSQAWACRGFRTFVELAVCKGLSMLEAAPVAHRRPSAGCWVRLSRLSAG